jgi:hypothetical protein
MPKNLPSDVPSPDALAPASKCDNDRGADNQCKTGGDLHGRGEREDITQNAAIRFFQSYIRTVLLAVGTVPNGTLCPGRIGMS